MNYTWKYYESDSGPIFNYIYILLLDNLLTTPIYYFYNMQKTQYMGETKDLDVDINSNLDSLAELIFIMYDIKGYKTYEEQYEEAKCTN